MTKARDLANIGTTLATVSTTELGYLDGVTSAIQTQIDGKQAANAAVSTTELGYLDGVTSAIQTQLDGKSGTSHNHDSTYIAKTLTTTTGDMIYASSANTPARLAIGSSSQVLTVSGGVPTWATPAAGGKVLQVVEGSTTTQTGTTSASYTDSGLSATITPTSSSSKILVIVAQPIGEYSSSGGGVYGAWNVVRGSTEISASGISLQLEVPGASGAYYYFYHGARMVLDSPATTSATTYKTQGRVNAAGSGKSLQFQWDSTRASMVLLEIGA